MLSINSSASLSVQSTGSYKRGLGLKEKLAEMETFKDILCRQVETLQTYFDACANSQTDGFEPYHKEFEKSNEHTYDDSDEDNDDNGHHHHNSSSEHTLKNKEENPETNKLNKARMEDHAAMRLDFKGEAFTFKATTTGILHNLGHCIELMVQREDFLKKKLDKEIDRRKKLEEQIKEMSKDNKRKVFINTGPDFEEGPHCNIKEEQFFDAIDSTLDTLELEEERRFEATVSLQKDIDVGRVPKHRLSEQIEQVVGEHLKYDLQDDLNSNVWELLCSDGEMKIYRRELEENGLVLDPLKAVHTVKGITGHELCKYFWDPAVRMEWEGTLDSSRLIETLSEETLIFHQVHKRVWPTAQRDTCFWSHIRSTPHTNDESTDLPDWIVVNHSTNHEIAPSVEPQIRAWVNVSMLCTTIVLDKEKFTDQASIPRSNLVCKINYVAQVNPGGWAPANVLRAVYKREYPKFVKRFTEYVINKTKKQPILF
jgi:collagen type IV alpha-3-binding protein